MTERTLPGISGNPGTATFESELTQPGFDPLNTVISEVLGHASLHHRARLLIMRALLRVLCRHAPAGLQAELAGRLRAGTERIVARTDKKPLPDAFYHALLDEMNRYLECL